MNDGVVPHAHMIRQPRLTADHHAIANARTATHSDLGDNQTIAADHRIVSNLDEIIELRAMAYPRLSKRPSINTCSRSDLDLILDDHISQRMDSNDLGVEVFDLAGFAYGFNTPRLTRHEGASIPADRRIGLDDHPATDLATVPDANAGVEKGVISDRHFGTDADVGNQPAMIADPAVWTDPAKWTNRDVLANAGGRIDDRPGMYSGSNVNRSLEEFG